MNEVGAFPDKNPDSRLLQLLVQFRQGFQDFKIALKSRVAGVFKDGQGFRDRAGALGDWRRMCRG
jgi:hypothetical protein